MIAELEKKEIIFSVRTAPVLREFLRDESFISLIQGPFGSGKSSTCIAKIIKLTQQKQLLGPGGIKRSRWAVVRNTYGQLRDTTLQTVKKWMPEQHFGTLTGGETGPWNYYITGMEGVKIELLFRALDRPDHVKNLLSLDLTGAWLNEYREIAKENFEAVQGRVGRWPSWDEEGCGWWGVIGDTNPPEETSYYYNLIENHCPDNHKLFKQPSGLSPEAENIDNLPPNYYTNLAKGKKSDWINVYIHGRYGFISSGEAVTPEYNADLHRAKEPLEVLSRCKSFRAYDGGLNPTCIVGQISPTGQVRIYRTFRGENIGMEQLIDTMLIPYLSSEFKDQKIDDWMDVGDPSLANREQSSVDSSAAKVIEKKLRRFGCKGFVEGAVRWDPRLNACREGLNKMISGRPWVLLDPRDLVLHKALNGGWHYPETSSGKALKDKPLKDIHSHPGDSFSYLMAELLGYHHEATEIIADEDADMSFMPTALSGRFGI